MEVPSEMFSSRHRSSCRHRRVRRVQWQWSTDSLSLYVSSSLPALSHISDRPLNVQDRGYSNLYLSLRSPRRPWRHPQVPWGEFLRIYSSDKHADIMGFVPPPRLLHQLVEKSEGYFVSCHKVVVIYDLKHLYRLYWEFGRDMNRTESIIRPILHQRRHKITIRIYLKRIWQIFIVFIVPVLEEVLPVDQFCLPFVVDFPAHIVEFIRVAIINCK